MLGTLVNTVTILLGSFIGMIIKGNLKEKYREIMLQAVGISVVFVGISSAISKLLLPESHAVLYIISLVIGAIAGTWLDIEGRLKDLGIFLENKLSSGENSIADGFVKASLLFCVGTMAILGSLESGIHGNHATLFAKATLDGITSIIFSSALGLGVMLSAFSVLIYQGLLTILAQFIEPYLTQDMLREISLIGGILITTLGLDMLGIKKIKTGNMLPAVLVPVIYYLIVGVVKPLL